MTISMVEVVSENSETLQFPFKDLSANYYITNIEGLDPVKAELTSSSYGTVDGAQLQATRRESRNIVITLEYNPDWESNSVRSLRQILYSNMMPESNVLLRFILSDDTVAEITGTVESFESPIFAKDPEATLSVICFKPDFYDPDQVTWPTTTAADLTENVLTYDGNIASGFLFRLLVDRELADFTLFVRGPDSIVYEMDFAAPLDDGDIVEISTVPGNKYCQLIRSGVASSLLYAISPQSDWPFLKPGANNIRVYCAGAAVDCEFIYTKMYGGL